jgi:hypothetical protein
MSTIEVTILGGPHDGSVYGVRAGIRDIRLAISLPPPVPGYEGPWDPYYEVDVPIHLTRNGYRADWYSYRLVSATTTGDTP